MFRHAGTPYIPRRYGFSESVSLPREPLVLQVRDHGLTSSRLAPFPLFLPPRSRIINRLLLIESSPFPRIELRGNVCETLARGRCPMTTSSRSRENRTKPKRACVLEDGWLVRFGWRARTEADRMSQTSGNESAGC